MPLNKSFSIEKKYFKNSFDVKKDEKKFL